MEIHPHPETWNEIITSLPGSHLLQSWEWGQLKAHYGWKPIPLIWRQKGRYPFAAVLILLRTLPMRGLRGRYCLLYAPKGPLLDWKNEDTRQKVLADLQFFAQDQRAIFLKIDPDIRLGTGIPGSPEAMTNPAGQAITKVLSERGWKFSDEQVQFRNTVHLDLTLSEDDLLARMKQKTRYNIRLSARKGVQVRPGQVSDLDLLYDMYAQTSIRDGFPIRDKQYYLRVWAQFMEADLALPLLAEVNGAPVAAVVIYTFGKTAYYLFGMSGGEHREKMPNHLLQWEAIRWAKARGCSRYDLWGAPDNFVNTDSLWGVFRFKQGFNGQVVRHIGAWDLPIRKRLYRLYTQTLPRFLNYMRQRGLEQTRRSIQNGG